MLRDHFLAFDEYMVGPVTGSLTLYTSDLLASRLARHDALVVYVVAEELGGVASNLSVNLETSGDGRHWAIKYVLVSAAVVAASVYTCLVGYDAAVTSTLTFARLSVMLQGSGSKARVRIHASMRDIDGDQPAGVPLRHPTPPTPDPVNPYGWKLKQDEAQAKNHPRVGPAPQKPYGNPD